MALVTTDEHKESHRAGCTHPRITPGASSPLFVTPMSPLFITDPNIRFSSHIARGGVLVGEALYFNAGGGIIECQVGTLSLSVFEKPMINDNEHHGRRRWAGILCRGGCLKSDPVVKGDWT